GRDRLPGLPDLRGIGVPARVDDGARGRDCAVAAERLRQVLGELEALRLPEAAAARDEDVGALDVHIGAALFAADEHRGLPPLRAPLRRAPCWRRTPPATRPAAPQSPRPA